ncbi:hypothetical protein [Prosthecobacter sp.]|uniref:hypothetical protein n=1 Tax=Prosthecobacter sp. TaxID=1965333 RepID=UPI003783D06E
MNSTTSFRNTLAACLLLAAGAAHSQEKKDPPDSAAGEVKTVMLAKFALKVPSAWPAFSSADTIALRSQFLVQSKQIYQQYSGSADDPAKSVDVAAFHLEPDDGVLIAVALSIPPQADLINTLRREAGQKAEWGVQQGYIRQYLGLVAVDDGELSGFYIKSIGKGGGVEVSGGLEHKKLKNTLIQLTLIAPKSWDMEKAVSTLKPLLKSIRLPGEASEKTPAKQP